MLIRLILIGIVIMLVARAFWRVVDGVLEGAGVTKAPRRAGAGQAAAKLVRDPVCGTYILPNHALSLPEKGGTRYFCSEACRRSYLAS